MGLGRRSLPRGAPGRSLRALLDGAAPFERREVFLEGDVEAEGRESSVEKTFSRSVFRSLTTTRRLWRLSRPPSSLRVWMARRAAPPRGGPHRLGRGAGAIVSRRSPDRGGRARPRPRPAASRPFSSAARLRRLGAFGPGRLRPPLPVHRSVPVPERAVLGGGASRARGFGLFRRKTRLHGGAYFRAPRVLRRRVSRDGGTVLPEPACFSDRSTGRRPTPPPSWRLGISSSYARGRSWPSVSIGESASWRAIRSQ